MCLQPILIKNTSQYKYTSGIRAAASSYYVPCGHCAQCYHNRQNELIQKIRQIYKYNYCFFVTLTYYDSIIYDDHHTLVVNGNPFSNVLIEDISLLFKRIRNHWNFPFFECGKSLKYHFFSEFGGQTHRPHWHGIIQVPKVEVLKSLDVFGDVTLAVRFFENYLDNAIQAEWKTQIGGTHRKPIYQANSKFFKPSLYTRGTYDFHLVQDVYTKNGKMLSADNVAFYITKYMLKPDDWLNRYLKALRLNYPFEVYNHMRPKQCISKNADENSLDDIFEMVKKNYSLLRFPTYETPDGKTYPLSNRYRKILPPEWLNLDKKFNPQNWERRLFVHIDKSTGELLRETYQDVMLTPYVVPDQNEWQQQNKKAHFEDIRKRIMRNEDFLEQK